MTESSAAEDVAFDAPGAVTGKCCKQKLSQPKIWMPANQPRLAPQPCGVSPLVFFVVSFTFPAAGGKAGAPAARRGQRSRNSGGKGSAVVKAVALIEPVWRRDRRVVVAAGLALATTAAWAWTLGGDTSLPM